jgi:hypothetical protein
MAKRVDTVTPMGRSWRPGELWLGSVSASIAYRIHAIVGIGASEVLGPSKARFY